MTTKINDRQEKFLTEYVIDFNITRAYQAVYGIKKTPNAAAASGSGLLTKPNVKERLNELLEERRQSASIDATYVVEYLKGAAELDLEEFATIGRKGVELKEFKNIPKSVRKYCTDVNMTEAKSGKVIVNFKIFSKEKAIEMLAKHTGATRERVELTGSLTLHSITDLVKSHS